MYIVNVEIKELARTSDDEKRIIKCNAGALGIYQKKIFITGCIRSCGKEPYKREIAYQTLKKLREVAYELAFKAFGSEKVRELSKLFLFRLNSGEYIKLWA